MPFYGLAVVCGDDKDLSAMIDDIARPVQTFGFEPHNDVQAIDLNVDGTKSHFTVLRRGRDPLPLTLNIPGKHNVLNALAAVTMATDEGVDDEAIKQAVAKFAGVGRRFEQNACVSKDDGDVILIDDYGHHPVEVAATINAARQSYPDRRLVMLFQPHRYSRTRDCFDEFITELSQVDELLLLDVYSAGEAPIQGATTKDLARSIRLRGEVEPTIVDKDNLAPVMQRVLKAGDLLITQGAGNVGQISQELAQNELYINSK